MLHSNALFLWRQEDTSSLRLLSDDRLGRQIIKNFSLRQRLHLLLELLYDEHSTTEKSKHRLPIYAYIYIYVLCKKNGTVRKLFFTLIYICKRTAFLQKYIYKSVWICRNMATEIFLIYHTLWLSLLVEHVFFLFFFAF